MAIVSPLSGISCKKEDAPSAATQVTAESLEGVTIRISDGGDWIKFRGKNEVEMCNVAEKRVLLGSYSTENNSIRIVMNSLAGQEVVYLQRQADCYVSNDQRKFYTDDDLKKISNAKYAAKREKELIETEAIRIAQESFESGAKDSQALEWLQGTWKRDRLDEVWTFQGETLKLKSDAFPAKVVRITGEQETHYRNYALKMGKQIIPSKEMPTHIIALTRPATERRKASRLFYCVNLPRIGQPSQNDIFISSNGRDSPAQAWEQYMGDPRPFRFLRE